LPRWCVTNFGGLVPHGRFNLLASSGTRQSDAECSAMWSDGGNRQRSTMSFDDQPANCQPHPHAIGLCCEERVKDTVDVFVLVCLSQNLLP
jgi:hypothetical protein